jgi:hypothetical protein
MPRSCSAISIRIISPAAPDARPDLARAAVEARSPGPLGLSVEAAALGIHRIVNTQMAEGIRYVSRSSRAMTRAASLCCRWVVPGRCTPARWPKNSP